MSVLFLLSFLHIYLLEGLNRTRDEYLKAIKNSSSALEMGLMNRDVGVDGWMDGWTVANTHAETSCLLASSIDIRRTD